MPIMFGFAAQRRQMLEAELVRIVEELPALGVISLYVTGDFGRREVRADTPLEVVVVHETPEPFRRRAEFFVDHLRPRLETHFWVYTPDEFERHAEDDSLLRGALALAAPAYTREETAHVC